MKKKEGKKIWKSWRAAEDFIPKPVGLQSFVLPSLTAKKFSAGGGPAIYPETSTE